MTTIQNSEDVTGVPDLLGDQPVGIEGVPPPEGVLAEALSDTTSVYLPPSWNPLVDWLTDAASTSPGRANAVHFQAYKYPERFGYQGYAYYRPAQPPIGWRSMNRFSGVGHIYPTFGWGDRYKASGLTNLPAPWMRLTLAFRAGLSIAGITFHNGSLEAGYTGIHPTPVGYVEEDLPDLQPLLDGTYLTWLGPQGDHWAIRFQRTTQLHD